jgi:5-methylcytosine-specific restriction endonuclease McrA
MSAIPQPSHRVAVEAASRPPGGARLLSRGVLVLNRHWTAVHVCTVRRAMALLCQDLARVVTEDYQAHTFDSWRDLSEMEPGDGPHIHTPRFALRVPDVIVLARYNRVPPRRVRFNRRNIFLRDNFACQYCGARPPRDELTLDHVVARARGGASTWGNVVVACVACNMKKGSRLLEQTHLNLRRTPKRPHWLSCVNVAPGRRGRSVWQRFVDNAYWTASLEE